MGRESLHSEISEYIAGELRAQRARLDMTIDALARAERLAERRAEAEARLRAAVVEAVAEGCPVAPLARAAGVTRPTVYRWVDAAK